MERDFLIVHGASPNLKERLCMFSDPYTIHVCNTCNILVWRQKQGLLCYSCKSKSEVVQVYIPYTFNLLNRELCRMGICLKFWIGSFWLSLKVQKNVPCVFLMWVMTLTYVLIMLMIEDLVDHVFRLVCLWWCNLASPFYPSKANTFVYNWLKDGW